MSNRVAFLNPSTLLHTLKLSKRTYFSKISQKHYDPRFRKQRSDSIIKIDLPSYEDKRKRETMDFREKREFMMKEGLPPDITFDYMPISLSCTAELMEPYKPSADDGRSTSILNRGIRERFNVLKAKGSNLKYLRKIREFEENFDVDIFASVAQEVYINAHKALMSRDANRLHELVTEHCYPNIVSAIERKSIDWKWVQSLEPPIVVHMRTGQMLSKTMIFGQVTVRMFSKQIIAVYDRFGRLFCGHPKLENDTLEYVVFERLLSDPYSPWRLHAKIVPDWMRDSSARTYYTTFVCPPLQKEFEVKEDVRSDEEKLALAPGEE